MKKILLIGFILIFTISCNKDNIETQWIKGTWIESVFKTDTLEFSSESEKFILNRGKEIRDGFLLPKPHSGPYFYELEKDSICLRYGFSSSFDNHKYYFELDEKNELIRMGNFFVDSLKSKDEMLVFIKPN